MTHKEFLKSIDEVAVVEAIREAEKTTSGEIRVFVSRKRPPRDGVYSAALRQFRKLGMHRTAERNGVLLYLAPLTREMAVAADEGIHAKCGALPWRMIISDLKTGLASEDRTAAIIHAIGGIAKVLGRYFPRKDGDRKE